MTYQMIQPPFSLELREMSKQQLSEYATWFHSILDERNSELEEEVRTTPGYKSWKADFTPESLGPLGEWFVGAVTTRPFTADELASFKLRGRPIEPAGPQLTELSISIAIDVGLYIARTFERTYPQLTWKQFRGDKRNIDYGQPVLAGFGFQTFNPLRIATNVAYGIASGEKSGGQLLDLYHRWSDKITAPEP